MKKSWAILLLVLFFFSQFGKVISFCLCTITTYQQTNSFHCDCEKQLAASTDTDARNQTPLPATIVHHYDELYHLDHFHEITTFCSFCSTSFPPEYTSALYHSYSSSVFHPPASIC